MKWRSHPGMAATVAARGRRGWYWITATNTGYQVLKAAGFDGLSIMIHTPHGTIEIPHAGKVCRDLATAKAHAADLDSAPDYEAQVSGT